MELLVAMALIFVVLSLIALFIGSVFFVFVSTDYHDWNPISSIFAIIGSVSVMFPVCAYAGVESISFLMSLI